MSKKDEMPLPAAASISAPIDKRKTVEQWKKELKTPDWLFAAAMAGAFKAEGLEVTEVQYKSALQHTANEPVGYTTAGVRTVRDQHASVDPFNPEQVAAYESKFIRRRGGSK